MSTVQEIKISNCGPVEHVSIPIPEGGGITVLRGRNGVGKTRSLEAVESALTGRGKVDVRDGALRGEVDACGVKLTVARSTRRTGELEVQSLDGKLSISDLIDPGMKSPDAADARRIKALVSLSGAKPSAELFHPIMGGKEAFEAVVGTAALASDDMVAMAERIKRDLEAAARKEEQQAEHADGRARGAREATTGVDAKAPCDADALQADLEVAIREESRLKSESESAAKAKQSNQVAADQLEDAEAKYKGLTLADATLCEAEAKSRCEEAEKALRAAEEALRAAQSAHESARLSYSGAISNRKNAEQHEAMVRQWREQLAGALPAAPAPAELTAAAERVLAARQAVEQGALVRRAKQQLTEGDKHAEQAKGHRERAAQLRTAAQRTDEVLSDLVAKSGSPLRVEHGRLVLDTRRGSTHFHDLSAGERSRIAVDIGIDAVGSRGVLTLSQEIYEGLDPQNRDSLAAHAVSRQCVILTAEASGDDEIRAEVYGEN